MCSSSKGRVWGWIAALSVIAELLVFTAAAPVNVTPEHEWNVAVSKSCSQSSHRSSKNNGFCGRALNGNKTGYYYDEEPNSNCQHTSDTETTNWWSVDLGLGIYIHKIIIYARVTFPKRMENISVILNGIEYCNTGASEGDARISFDSPQKVRYIQLTRIGQDQETAILNFCELEAYSCNFTRWGESCETKCGTGCPHSVPSHIQCDRITGACSAPCLQGWRPPICEECKNNTLWGEYCNSSCPAGCKDGTVNCNRTTGVCIECPDGKWGNNCSDACGEGCNETNCHLNGTCHCRSHWMPPNCDVCNPGKWGPDCLNDCGEGCKGGLCNMTNGHCNCTSAELIAPLCGGCNPGKWGKNCENDCGVGCEGETCKKDDGSCECQPGWVGTKCDGRPCECGEYECTTSGKYIFADVPRKVNVAIGKPSKASTIKKVDNDDSAVCSCLANDGYLSTTELTTCMSTAEGDPAPFWELDLGEKYEIAGINIDFDDDDKMRRSGISILLDGKEIFVTNDQTTDPAYIPNNKRRNWIGQVLKLQRKGPRIDPLMICEVEVFNCMPGFYGYECEGICERPVCDNGKFCSRIDGSCPKTVEVKETTDCSPLILVAGYVVGFLIISLFIFAAKVIPYKKKSKPKAVKKEAEGDKVEEGSESRGDKEESQAESGQSSGTDEKESQV